MKHLGDITKINGAEIPAVDVITFGAPCQDLSVAGLRKGMLHADLGDEETSRSGLFMDAVRIIKEMRENEIRSGRTGIHVRPRYAIYENVPGAFSSNGGKDFQTVLTELARIVEPNAPAVPLPDRGGWDKAGCVYDEMGRWSIAYRIHDAQWWGVPQRRRRVCVICDFCGLTAPEILFDPQLRGETESAEPDEALRNPGAGRRSEIPSFREGLSRHPEQSGAPGQGASESAAGRSDGTGSISFQERAGRPGGAKESSCRMSEQEPCQPSTINPSWPESPEAYGISPLDSNGMKSDNPHSGFYRADTARTLDLNGGNPACNQGGGTCKESCAESVGPAEREDLRGNRTVSCSERELAGRAEPGRYSRLFGGLPERDGKPICERDPASEGAGTELEQQQRSQSADEVIRGGWHVPDVSHALKAKANCDYREDSETYICTTPPRKR